MATAPHYHPPAAAGEEALPVEPTFYLGGQPYIFDDTELSKAGPELAEHALMETHDQLVRLNVLFHGNAIVPEDGQRMTREEFVHRATELSLGILSLMSVLGPYAPYLRRAVRTMGLLAGHVTGLFLITDIILITDNA